MTTAEITTTSVAPTVTLYPARPVSMIDSDDVDTVRVARIHLDRVTVDVERIYHLDADDELGVQRIEYIADHPDVLDAAAVDALTTCLALARRVAELPTPIESAAAGSGAGVEHG